MAGEGETADPSPAGGSAASNANDSGYTTATDADADVVSTVTGSSSGIATLLARKPVDLTPEGLR